MKRLLLSYAVGVLFLSLVFQPTPFLLAGDGESGLSGPHVGQLSTVGRENDLSEEQIIREFEQFRREMEEKKLQEREAKLEEAAKELEGRKLMRRMIGGKFFREMEESAMKRMKEKAAELKKAGKENCSYENLSDSGLLRLNVLFVQEALGQFGYGTGPYNGKLDEKTRRALMEYQTYNGIPPTGCIGDRTYMTIFEDREALDQLVVDPPSYEFIDHSWDKYVAAQGTWTVLNGEQANRTQTSRIDCERQSMICTETTAIIERPPLESDLSFNLIREHHKIERWDSHEIITKPNDKVCVRRSVRISRSQKAVMGLHVPVGDKKLCGLEEQRELQLRLEDGLKVWSKLAAKRREARSRILRMDQFLSDLR